MPVLWMTATSGHGREKIRQDSAPLNAARYRRIAPPPDLPMFTLKRMSPWIACLALLLNMLAMPMSRAMQTPDLQLMLWGGFCSGGSSQRCRLHS
jgi:hypothetical protein